MIELKGKTISNVLRKPTWETALQKEQDIEELILEFEDGTKMSIHSSGGAGCHECDSDGSISQYLNIRITNIQERKQ